jgi:hypothetical protein
LVEVTIIVTSITCGVMFHVFITYRDLGMPNPLISENLVVCCVKSACCVCMVLE